MKKLRARIFIFGLLTFILGIGFQGCGSSSSNTTVDKNLMLSDIAQNVILKSYHDLQHETLKLRESVTDLCANPTQEKLTATQSAWRQARSTLKKMEVFSFGPYKDLSLDYKIDFWPSNPETIESFLANSETIDAETISSIEANARGFPAMEYLLFAKTSEISSPLENLKASPKRCLLLEVLSEDLSLQATKLYDAWAPESGNYFANFTRTSFSDSSSLQTAINDIINSMVNLLEVDKDTKIGKPFGKKSGGTPVPELVESRYSQNSIQDLIDNLEGIKNLYRGQIEGGALGLGIYDLIKDKDPWMADALVSLIDDAVASLQEIPTSLSDAVLNHPEAVQRSYGKLREIRTLISGPMSGLLGVSPYFSSNDGD